MIRPSHALLVVWACLVPCAALAWDSRDVAAAERFRDAERERAAAFRNDVAEGRIVPTDPDSAARETAREPARRQERREARRKARRKPGALERAIEDELDRWAERAGEWGEELEADLLDSIEQALRDALGGDER